MTKIYGVDVMLTYTNTYYIEADNPEQATDFARIASMDELTIHNELDKDPDTFDSVEVISVWEEDNE